VCTYKVTCESAWPPNASLYTSSTCDFLQVHLARALPTVGRDKARNGGIPLQGKQECHISGGEYCPFNYTVNVFEGVHSIFNNFD